MDILMPQGMDPNDFSAAMRRLRDGTVRIRKAKDDPRHVCEWPDELPEPSVSEIQTAAQDYNSEKRLKRLREIALDVAVERVAADVIADIEAGTIRDEQGVRNSDKYRVRNV